MHNTEGKLTDGDHNHVTFWINRILGEFKEGSLSRIEATEQIAHAFAALDEGNIVEVQNVIRRH